jgi:hypothetical protein
MTMKVDAVVVGYDVVQGFVEFDRPILSCENCLYGSLKSRRE